MQPDATDAADRRVPAPGLREVADVWFDTGSDPVVEWDEQARRFELADTADPANRLTLFIAAHGAAQPGRVARALAAGLAACDFPPTGDRADPGHVGRTLRAAGIDPQAP